MQQAKIGDIETLRGVSILLVLAAHLPMLMPWGAETYALTTKLQLGAGVDLFFAISGYVITRSIFQDIANGAGRGKDMLIRFWIRRFFRLIPAAIVAVLATLAAAVVFSDVALFKVFGPVDHLAYGAFAAVTQWFNIWGYLQVTSAQPLSLLAHFWSLSLEEQFYILWPIAVVLSPHKRGLIVGVMICMVGISVFPRSVNTDWAWWFRIDAVLWGCLIYLLLPSLRGVTQVFSNRWLASLMLLLGVVLLLGSVPLMGATAIAGTGTSFGAMLCVLVATLNKDMLQGFGPLSVALNYLGSRSYTIYLWHILIYTLVKAVWLWLFPGVEQSASSLSSVLVLLCLLPFALVIEFSYRVIEDRTRRVGQTLSERLSEKARRKTS